VLLVRPQTWCVSALASIGLWATPALANNDEDPFAPESEQPQAPPESGPELGLRLGLTNGIGSFESGNTVSKHVAGMLPLWVDAGYRVYDRWFLGFYWQYALGIPSSTSKSECESCVHSGIRYGLQVNYSILRGPHSHVWAGLGVGRHSFETVDEVTKRGTAYEGWEPLSVHLGSAWRPTMGIEIGPFFTLAYSTLSSRSGVCYAPDRADCPPEEKASLPNAGPIWWNTVGIRASFLP
jgi:hypothetical protein